LLNITDMTLTFVESHYPRDLLEHFEKVRNFTVEEYHPGIYNIKGDILPIQIIDNRKMSPDENVWLKNLDTRLDKPDI